MGSELKAPSARRRLIPVTHWNRYHVWPPIGGLRHLIFNAKRNGFERCLRRVGRTILIDEAEYFDWVDQQNKKELSLPETAKNNLELCKLKAGPRAPDEAHDQNLCVQLELGLPERRCSERGVNASRCSRSEGRHKKLA